MNVCQDDHDEIVYHESGNYGNSCPLCKALEVNQKLEKEIERLEKEMEDHVCEV